MSGTWNRQLIEIVVELEEVSRRAQKLADKMTDAAFLRAPAPDKWSPAECIGHLTITNKAYLPRIRDGIATGQALPPGQGKFRRDLMGWFLSRSLEPGAGTKMKTPHRFEPMHVRPRAEVITEFIATQRELAGLVAESNGLDLGRVKIASPFKESLHYNLYSCYRVIAAHERRHLSQAEAAARR